MRLPDPRSLIPDASSERERLPLWIPVLLATGIGLYFAQPDQPAFTASAMGLAGAVIMAALCWRWRGARLAAIATTLMALGFFVAAMRTEAIDTPVIYGQLFYRTVEGRIDDIQEKENGQKLFLSELAIERLSPQRTPKRITVTLKKPDSSLAIGDKIQMKAMLFAPPAPTLPGGYDFARAFYYDEIGAVGFAPSTPVVLEKAKERDFEKRLNALRFSLAERIATPMSPENAPVAAAMMVGEQAGVSEEVADAMRDAGIYHILSISGLHMTLAAGIIYATIRLLLSLYPPLAMRLPTKKIAASIGLLGAFFYLLLAGYPVPAVRSFVMVACVMLAVLFDRRGISLYSLAWAATLILLFEPQALLGVSFQLSFAATLAIVALYERFGHHLYKTHVHWLGALRFYFLGIMATSLVATLATTPLVMYHFNRVTLWGIVANTLTMPLASFIIMPAAVVAFLLMPFGLEQWPLVLLDQGIGWMIAGAKWFASQPHAALNLPPPTFIGILMVVYGGLWLCLWQKRWRLLGVPFVVLGLMSIALFKPYDLLVSDDATKVAIRLEDGEFLFIRGKFDSFDAESWLKAHGKETALTLTDSNAADCNNNICSVTLRGRRIVVARNKSVVQGLCNPVIDIVVAENTLVDPACASVPYVFDGKFLRARGAAALRIGISGIEIHTVAEKRGRWPWTYDPHSVLYRGDKPDIKNP